jgi:TolB protein
MRSQGNVVATNFVSWSKIVFQSYRDGNWEIYLADGDGSDQTRLTNHGASDAHPRFNRGCTRIIFASSRPGNHEIYTMNSSGSGLTRLTSNGADDVNPFWSPDGTKIAFQSYRDGQAEIYVMNADGSGQTRLTWDDAYDGGPAWSPDGTQIAFVSTRTGGYRIWVMNADGSGQTQYSTQPYSENPAWSPDGSQIAYDSDGDGDDWQELWLMNADGSNQREVYDAYEHQMDVWARSWSPDGRYVAFTRVSWIYYHGNWYWTEAYLDAWDSMNPWSTPTRLSSQGTDWKPDWQTTDAQAPTSKVHALPAQSPGPFTVNWSGSDTGPAGLKSYDVQVEDGVGGTWTDWQMETIATSASYPGVGGHTYYFRARARDNAYNAEPWPPGYDTSTTVEALPPTTAVQPLPPYSHSSLTVRWGGSDPGGSGIQTYDVQYRDADTEDWIDWQMGTTATSADLSGTASHTYHFRSRATDNAQNVEGWTAGDGDTYTTLYTWGVTGIVRDNADTPVAGMIVTTTPEVLAMVPSDDNGAYAGYVADNASTYTATWRKSGYGSLPVTGFGASQDARADVILPPADNVVLNWGFESGSVGPGDWVASGVITPVVTSDVRHTGNYAALLGEPFALNPPLNLTDNDITDQYPSLAVGADGVVHLVWREYDYDSGVYTIYYVQRNSDGVWSGLQSVTSDFVEAGCYPRLAVGENGVVHVVWHGYAVGGADEIFHAWRSSDGAWSSPQNISNNSGYSTGPRMAVDSSGVAHVVWTDDTSGRNELYCVCRDPGGTWSSPQSISGDTTAGYSTQLAVDKDNAVHVVWLSSSEDFYYARRDSNGTWSSPQLCASPSQYTDPRMAVDGNGNVHVVWYEWAGDGDYDVFYIQRSSTGIWSNPVELSGDLDGLWPDIAANEHGDVHVVWIGDGVYHVWLEGDGTWSGPHHVSGDFGASPSPRVAVDDNGTAHVVWGYRPSGYSWHWNIYYAQWNQDSGWISPQIISDDTTHSSSSIQIELGVSESGSVHTVWVDGSAYDWDIMYVGSTLATQSGESVITQIVTVPITMSTPILSFIYQLGGASDTSGTWFNVQVDDGINTTTLLSTTANAHVWIHRWFDMVPWVGQTVILTFGVHETAGYPHTWAYLDEVTIGSAYPDLWVGRGGLAALPCEQVAYTIGYGNRGGAAASGVRITDTLPGELFFVDASPPPITTTPPLAWDVGDISAKSGPFNIVVTVTVAPTATLWSTLSGTVSIGTTSPELETANNVAQAAIFVGRRMYMPLIFKGYFERP